MTRSDRHRQHTSPSRPRELWPSELAVADTVGRLIEFWGFKRNMGRIWSVLYLSDEALTARELEQGLGVSAGTVSMTLAELQRWGVVRQVWRKGARRRLFEAETDLWMMITRVLRERELGLIESAHRDLERALEHATERMRTARGAERQRAQVQRKRIKVLLDVSRFGRSLVVALVTTGRVDASPLTRLLRRRSS